jgi:signal transduction histidine kinase
LILEEKENKIDNYLDEDAYRFLSFLQFSTQDEENLKALSEVFKPNIPDIVSSFYQYLQKFEDTSLLLTDDIIKTRLLKAQSRYLERLTQGNYDHQYLADRKRIGVTHSQVGLTTKWYIGAYNLYLHLLYPLIFQAYSDKPEQVQDSLLSLTKILMLDMQLAMDAYIEHQQLESQHIQSERFTAIGQLAAQVAHEIRNPLSSIELNLDLLADEILDEPKAGTQESRNLLRSIRNEVDRLADIVSEYLTFARVPRFEFEEESMNAIVQKFCHFVKPQLHQSKITLKLDLDESLPSLLLDTEQIQRILHNFLKNGIEAMPEGGEFTFRTRTKSEHIVLEITDTGEGISHSDLKKIFDPFFTTKRDGTGLGLPIAQEVIKHHQGEILCESIPKKGTKFSITFPVSFNKEVESDHNIPSRDW